MEWKGQLMVVLFFLTFCFFDGSAENVTVTIDGGTSIADTDDSFICATIDWWPAQKCNYNTCPWGSAGFFSLDLQNFILQNAVKAFNKLRIRLGGSLQDKMIYEVGDAADDCPPLQRAKGQLFGFSKGCLTMKRWDELNSFINQTGALLTFGLNALTGKQKPKRGITWTGDWDGQNARDLIEYTLSKGYKIHSYELGNELCGSGVGARLEAGQYAKDLLQLRKIVEEVYINASSVPQILGPGGFYQRAWFQTFLEAVGPHGIDGMTHHIYNLGGGNDPNLINKIQDPYFISKVAQNYKDILDTIQQSGPWASPWVGESGGAYNSGGQNVSRTFVDGFWYLDQLGMTATFKHKVFCRQALIGGFYSLLNTTDFVPNPDYYGALLWHRLMGKRVLATAQHDSAYLRAYSHCAKQKPGVSILLINMSNSTKFQVEVQNGKNLKAAVDSGEDAGQQREEYHLTPKNGYIQSEEMLLNGELLSLTKESDIPEMNPKLVNSSKPIVVAPDSFVFVVLRDFKAPACL